MIYPPVAGTAAHVLLLLGRGGSVGFRSGLFSVGGGFLMTPLLIMMGIRPTVAAASDSNQSVAATASGTYAHARAGAVDFRMGALLLVGNLGGGTPGVARIGALRRLGQADLFINAIYGVMLGGVGADMLWDSLREVRGLVPVGLSEARPPLLLRLSDGLPWRMEFPRSKVSHSVLVPLALGGSGCSVRDHGRRWRVYEGAGYAL